MKRFNIMDNGYRYDRMIFWCAFLIILSWLFVVAARNDFSFSQTKIFITCKDPHGCMNPLVENENYYLESCQEQLRILFFVPLYTAEDCRDTCTEAWCTQAMLAPGTYGTPPDPWIKHTPALIIAILVVSLLFNHLVHNRGKRLKVQLNLKPETRAKLKRIFTKLED